MFSSRSTPRQVLYVKIRFANDVMGSYYEPLFSPNKGQGYVDVSHLLTDGDAPSEYDGVQYISEHKTSYVKTPPGIDLSFFSWTRLSEEYQCQMFP